MSTPSIGTLLRETLRTPLRRYQVQGVRFVESLNGRALIGDDMGLGKTIQAIGWSSIRPDSSPCIIVCPAPVKFVWQRQLKEHAGLEATVLEGRKPYSIPKNGKWIINYDILQYWAETLLDHNPKLLILDECHRISNRKAKRTKACVSIGKNCPYVIGLSGTPIVSRPIEFFPILNLLNRELFPSFWSYAMRYCNPRRAWRGVGWDFNGASHTDELHELVSQVMVRRMKCNVAKDLPPKIITVLPTDIDNWEDYSLARDEFITWIKKNKGETAYRKAKGALAIVRLGALKQIVAEGKIASLEMWIKEWLSENEGKLIVFTLHRKTLALLRKLFPSSAQIQGQMTTLSRTSELKRFLTDPKCRVLFGQMKAAGEGIDGLQDVCSTVLFAELGWTPATHDQAMDRTHRIGQKAKTVNVFFMVGRNTIEDDIMDILDSKRKVVGAILDGEEAEGSIVNILLTRMIKE